MGDATIGNSDVQNHKGKKADLDMGARSASSCWHHVLFVVFCMTQAQMILHTFDDQFQKILHVSPAIRFEI